MAIPENIIKTLENNNPKDTVISISSGLSDLDIYKLVILLEKNNYITELDLSDNNIGDKGALELNKLTRVNKINLQNNNVSVDAAKKLITNTNFVYLNLARNNLSRGEISELKKAIHARGENTLSLDVRFNILGEENENYLMRYTNPKI